jgi:hypothetical protein
MSLGTPTSVSKPLDYVDLLSDPNALGTFAHTHPNNAMVPSAPDFNNFAHAHPWYNNAKTFPDNWILGADENAGLYVPRLDEQARHGDLRGGAIGSRFFPQYYDAIKGGVDTMPMMTQVEEIIRPLARERMYATKGVWTAEDSADVARARSILASAFPHNELRKGGLDMSVDPALEVFRPLKGEHAPLTIGQAWPELIDRLDTLGASPIRTQDWLPGYEEGGPVTDEDYGAYVSQYFDEGGQVEPEGYANGGLIRKWLKTIGDTMRQPLGVAVPEEVLPKIAEDGRFKSLFETGTSGGSKNTERRGNTELNMFGVPINADPSARPIYGHLFHPEEPDSIAGQYGDWISVLHPSVKNRATVTWGDSLDLTPDMNLGPYKFDQRPAELLRPRAQDKFSLRRGELYRDIPEDFRSLVRSDDVWWPGYLEAQIHGGLPWSDVTNLISVPAATPDAVRRAADRFGRPVYAQDALTENFPEPWLRAMPGASRVDEFIDGFPLSEIGYAEGGQVEEDVAPPRGYFGGC